MLKEILANPVFLGVFGGTVSAMLMSAMRTVPATIMQFLREQLVVSIQVSGDQPFFQETLSWLKQATEKKRLRSFNISGTPGKGNHFFWYHGPFWVNRHEKEHSDQTLETLTLSFLGWGTRRAKDLRLAIMQTSEQPDKVQIRITDDRYFGARNLYAEKRALSSVILNTDTKKFVIKACQDFIAKKQWYQDRGVPWRLGFLLHGVPGTGKSSLVKAVASELGVSITFADISNETLSTQLSSVPENGIVLMEDVDRGDPKEREKNFRGVINCLDGVTASEGRILFMTTNHIDQLDPALIREGRIDHRVELTALTPGQVGEMAVLFYGEPSRSAWVTRAEQEPANVAAYWQVQLLQDGDAR
jgi:mitochondrial chaperone BCS1